MKTRFNRRNRLVASLACLIALSANAEQSSQSPMEVALKPLEASVDDDRSPEKKPVCAFPKERDAWLDRVRESTHSRLCFTARWIDSRFGKSEEFDDKNFQGKISLGLSYDTLDGFDPKLRVRIKTKLPNASSRMNVFLGRVEEEGYVSNTESSSDTFNPSKFHSRQNEDADWLVGIGYQNPNKTENGFDYSIGAKLSSGISPYAKAVYRRQFQPTESEYWRTTQTFFWRRKEKFGVSSNLKYTRVLTDRDLLEWETTIKFTEKADQIEWATGTTILHSLSEDRGISSRLYIQGEDRGESLVSEYGISLMYVRPFLRPWMNIETGVDLRMERDIQTGEFTSGARFAVQFEMLLGDYYSRSKN